MITSLPHVVIAGCGSAVPRRIVTNEDLEASVGTNAEWILKNLGIRERRCVDGEQTSDLAAAAAGKALEDAGILPNDLDLLVLATSTPDRKAPSSACIVQRKIGMTNFGPAFDVSAVCSGFLYALNIAGQFVENTGARYALVIGADTFSTITDWSRRDCVFFGDAAGAVVLKHSPDESLFFSCMNADGIGHDNFTVFPGQKAFTMNGRAVYETATRVLPEAIREVLTANALTPSDITWVIPHQPSIRILQETALRLGIPFDRIKTNMDRYANTSGATIPLLLDEVKRSGVLRMRDLLLFAAVGAGWTWGATAYRWR